MVKSQSVQVCFIGIPLEAAIQSSTSVPLVVGVFSANVVASRLKIVFRELDKIVECPLISITRYRRRTNDSKNFCRQNDKKTYQKN